VDPYRFGPYDASLDKEAARPAERVQESVARLRAREVHEGAGQLGENRRRVKEGPAPWPPLRPSLSHRSWRSDCQIVLGSPVAKVSRDLMVRVVQRDLPTDSFRN